MARWDAVVIGGGPAGATAARLLAQWGHSVSLLTAPPAGRALAECLPPSTKKVFGFLGIQPAVEAAGFFETTGNTVWWGSRGRRVEPYPAGSGYQVDRVAFDRLLLDLARRAGVHIEGRADSLPVRSRDHIVSPANAKFVLDCSGRAGVLARAYRVRPRQRRTIALCGVWRSERGWRVPDASHTLVERYGDAWAWSVPLSSTIRHVAFMVAASSVRGCGIAAAYTAELARTRAFRRIFARGELQGRPWGRDASLYTSKQFCGPGFLLAGDAGSFIDPLSSFGVKKAMVSGWAAAVVANTCLRKPSMQETALRFFDEREREIENHYRKLADRWFQETEEDPDEPVRLALDDLKRRESVRLRLAPGVEPAQRAGIEGCEVVLRGALIAPGMAVPLDYVANVNVARLAAIAPMHNQVPDLFEAYNRRNAPVALGDFLKALATLIAVGVLEIRG